MQIRIGVRNVAREITMESDGTSQDVRDAVASALSDPDGLLSLTDERGATVLVPAQALGYVEIGASEKGRVGFGTT
ncbi:MAG: DUF3107 domain-containing protein [Ornithinimicrobium sp.]|uniref:DUF3107 domain-containing protein n=1 Tax=Ornithinimicrobium sp. TaxID=1977084 RepID=UPI001853529E|nr:DUF3107 domain-containing protein [Actinomycetota bacterium]